MANTAKQRIFFLDDEVDVCKAVRETLEGSGFEVSLYINRPVDCLKQLRYQRCDLLITDLKMPEMDGIELLKEVKRLAPWVPVLIVTGYGDVPTAVAAIKAGAVDFIEKPLGKENFVHKVTSILRGRPFCGSYTGVPFTQRETEVLN